MISPAQSQELFQQQAADGHTRIPVVREVLSDLDTPLSVYLKLADGPHTYLFESVEGGERFGRYSIIGFKPDVIWRCTKGKVEINRRARTDTQAFEPLEGRPLETLRLLIRECQMELPPGLPPMASGLFGFLGYDMVRDMEQLPDTNPDPIGLPDAIMVRPTLICIFDRLADKGGFPRADVGDIVAIFCAGAYGASASPAMFLGQGPAAEMLV